jgi:hypothetical protein
MEYWGIFGFGGSFLFLSFMATQIIIVTCFFQTFNYVELNRTGGLGQWCLSSSTTLSIRTFFTCLWRDRGWLRMNGRFRTYSCYENWNQTHSILVSYCHSLKPSSSFKPDLFLNSLMNLFFHWILLLFGKILGSWFVFFGLAEAYAISLCSSVSLDHQKSKY